MKKIEFKNFPDLTTPLSANNLNTLQDNIEEMFNGDEAMGNIVVDSIKSKNMFNKDSVGIGFFSSNGAIQTNSNYRYSNYIDVSNINKITISGVTNTGTAHIIEYNASKEYVDFWQSKNQTITLNANTKYVRVSMHIDDLNTYQIEKGSSATTYAPYQDLERKNVPKLIYSEMITGNITKEYLFPSTYPNTIYIIMAFTNGPDACLFDICYGDGTSYKTRLHNNQYVTATYSTGKVTIVNQYTTCFSMIELQKF